MSEPSKDVEEFQNAISRVLELLPAVVPPQHAQAPALPSSSSHQPRQFLPIEHSFSPWVPEARASTPALSLRSPSVPSRSSVLSRQQPQPPSACIAGPSGSSYSGASAGVTGQSAGMSCLMKFCIY